MFIDAGSVAITADGVIDTKDLTPETDAILIRPKMDYGTQQKVIGHATTVRMGQGRTGRGKHAAPGDEPMRLDVGAYNVALLTHNILSWRGPSFAGVACTPENIARLDPDEPLVQQVLRQINDRNVARGPSAVDDDDPNVLTLTPASTSVGASS